MTPPAAPARDNNHRLPGAILRQGVWLAARCPRRSRDVHELLLARGLDVTHDAIRQWCRPCGQAYAPQRKRRRAQPGATWPLEAVCGTMHGQRHSLWRAVDQDDNVLDILVQSRRHMQAATQCFRTLRKGVPDVPRRLVTEKLPSDGAAKRESLPGVAHRQSRSRDNRCEHAHRPTRQRAYRMQGLPSAGHAQRFLSASGRMAHHCRPRRPLVSAAEDRQEIHNRCESWADMIGAERAASRVKRTGERHPLV